MNNLIFDGRNRITSGYRLPDRPNHMGLDIVGDDSNIILSPVEGTVWSSTIIPRSSGDITWQWGHYVRINDAQGNRLFFCHMSRRLVSVGDRVHPGDPLGVMGNTGYSFGAHTHFEVRRSDGRTRINPAEYLGIPNAKGTYIAGSGFQTIHNKLYFFMPIGNGFGRLMRTDEGGAIIG